jgi:hypothetical protein
MQQETIINSLQCSRVVIGKTLVLWVVTSCTVSDRYRRFGWKKHILTVSHQTLKEATFYAETSVSTHKSTLCHNTEEHNIRKECLRSSCFWTLSIVLFLFNLFHIWLLLKLCRHLYSMISNGKISSKWRIRKDLKESGVFACRHRLKRRRTSARLAGVPPEIRSKYFLKKV